MCALPFWTPLHKQCFITLGVILNSMTMGLVTAFAPVLLDQLKTSHEIILNEISASWIVSITPFSIFGGSLIIPVVMNKQGRRFACLVTAAITSIGWICMCIASDIPIILLARLLLGLPMGFIAILAPVALGEYTSPKYRGMLLGAIPFAIYSGALVAHTLGSILCWKTISLIFGTLALIDIAILLLCPESPSVLAVHGKFIECRKAFRWLREPTEEEELDKMIQIQMAVKEANSKQTMGVSCSKIFDTITRREFYKPIIIMFHLHIINEWSGNTLHDTLTYDIYRAVIADDIDLSPFILTTDIQRILTSALAIFIIGRVSRRRMLFTTVFLNITSYLCLALYVYGKTYNLLPFDHFLVGAGLINLLLFSSAVGTLPLPNIISGEIFPLEYKGISSTVTVLFFSMNLFINMKIMPFLLNNIGLHGAFVVFACVLCYGTVVSWIMLPETKDRTLLDIEEEFRGYALCKQEENEEMAC